MPRSDDESIAVNAELERVARRLVWWKPPAEALADPHRLLAQVMVYGTIEDVVAARRHFHERAFRDVLSNPPSGVFDPRSWAYWHVVFGLEPPKKIRGRALEEFPHKGRAKNAPRG